MTDAIRELFELLAKKENTGSDYTGTITRVDGNTAYVRFNGSDIDDTPVALSIGASEGDTVRVRVADGRAWLVGNDTAPPNDSGLGSTFRSSSVIITFTPQAAKASIDFSYSAKLG